jgi:drug/metabolite transporter (DMT)-like permease
LTVDHPSSAHADPASSSSRVKADLTLLTVAVVWGSAFSAQRVVAAHVGFFLYNGLRFLLGALTLLPMMRGRWRALDRIESRRMEWRGGLLAGLLLAGASALQQAGLRFTTAGKAGFITGLYVVLVPLFLAVGWRRWPRPAAWVASLLAATGLFLLNAERALTLSLGDGLEAAGAALWALHLILIGRLANHVDSLRLAWVQYLVCGLSSTALGLGLEAHTLPGLATAWWAVIYGGVLSVGLGFTLQVVGQKVAPATDAAIILSTEAVFAALFGWLLLGETLSARQMAGCGLMLGGMVLAQLPVLNPPAVQHR